MSNKCSWTEATIISIMAVNSYSLEQAWSHREQLQASGLFDGAIRGLEPVGDALEAAGYTRGDFVVGLVSGRIEGFLAAATPEFLDRLEESLSSKRKNDAIALLCDVKGVGPVVAENVWRLMSPEYKFMRVIKSKSGEVVEMCTYLVCDDPANPPTGWPIHRSSTNPAVATIVEDITVDNGAALLAEIERHFRAGWSTCVPCKWRYAIELRGETIEHALKRSEKAGNPLQPDFGDVTGTIEFDAIPRASGATVGVVRLHDEEYDTNEEASAASRTLLDRGWISGGITSIAKRR